MTVVKAESGCIFRKRIWCQLQHSSAYVQRGLLPKPRCDACVVVRPMGEEVRNFGITRCSPRKYSQEKKIFSLHGSQWELFAVLCKMKVRCISLDFQIFFIVCVPVSSYVAYICLRAVAIAVFHEQCTYYQLLYSQIIHQKLAHPFKEHNLSWKYLSFFHLTGAHGTP